MVKKISRKKRAKSKGEPIYSRLSLEDSISVKKNILEMQAGMLSVMQTIENYKELRKRELMWKLKLKKNVKDVKENVTDILKAAPKTSGSKEIEKEHREKRQRKNKTPVGLSIESELMDIQRKLEEINKK